MCKAGEQIDLGDTSRRLANATRIAQQLRAKLCKDATLDLPRTLLRREDLGLIVFQLWRGEPLRVDQRLLALVVSGHGLRIGLGHFKVITEDAVEGGP